jgi:hypothetical protein
MQRPTVFCVMTGACNVLYTFSNNTVIQQQQQLESPEARRSEAAARGAGMVCQGRRYGPSIPLHQSDPFLYF